MKRKQAKAPRPLTVSNYNWGSIFSGTKEQLIAAKLASPEQFKRGGKKEYRLPLNFPELYQAAVFGPNRGKIPPAWEADIGPSHIPGVYEVRVSFDPVADLNIRQRVNDALMALRAALRIVEEIAPVPLAVQLGVKAKESDRME